MPRTRNTQTAATDQEAAPVSLATQLRKALSAFIRAGTDENYDEVQRLMNAHQATFVNRYQRHRTHETKPSEDGPDNSQ